MQQSLQLHHNRGLRESRKEEETEEGGEEEEEETQEVTL